MGASRRRGHKYLTEVSKSSAALVRELKRLGVGTSIKREKSHSHTTLRKLTSYILSLNSMQFKVE
jgi:hypothetical protein